MIAFPNAKINLGLNVCFKRPDGYHHIETVFYPIPLCDVLEVVHAPENDEAYTWHSSGLNIDEAVESNICIKALELMKQHYPIGPVQIHLHKVIPFGAGLGGGSSDGAAMFHLLDQLMELNMPEALKNELATKLGADCAFFLKNQPAYATGIGNELSPIHLDLSSYSIVLVKPPFHVSTPEAYQGIIPRQPDHILIDAIQQPVSEWKKLLKNDFEPSVFAKFPRIGQIKEFLYQNGAVYAAMSGSGSSVFGLFATETEINLPDCFVWKGKL